MRIAQKFAGLLAGRGGQPPEGLREEEQGADRQGAREVHRGLRGDRLRRGARHRSGSTSSSRSPTTRSTSPTPTATGSSATRRPTSRRTTRRSTWRRCSPASRPAWRRRRSTWPSAARWASRWSCPTSTARRATSPRRSPARRRLRGAADPLRPVGGAQRRRRAWSSTSSPSVTQNGPYEDFYDFCERVNTEVLNKKTIESLIKAGSFDAMGHPRQGLLHGLRADHRPDRRASEGARHGRHVAVRRGRRRDAPAFDERVADPRPRTSTRSSG